MANVTRQYKVHYPTEDRGHYPGNSAATETSGSQGTGLAQTTLTMGQGAKASNRSAIFLVYRLGGIPWGTTITSAKLIGTASASYTTTPATVRVGCTPNQLVNQYGRWRNVRRTGIPHFGTNPAYTPFLEVFNTGASSLGSIGSAGSSSFSQTLEAHGARHITLESIISDNAFGRTGPIGAGGAITPSTSGTLGSVQFEMVVTSNTAGVKVWAEVWSRVGNVPTVKLAESDKKDTSVLQVSPVAKQSFSFTGSNQIQINAGTRYYVLLTSDTDSDASIPKAQIYFNAGGSTSAHLITTGRMSHFSQGNFLTQKDYPFCLTNNADTNKSPYGTNSVTDDITLGNWTSGSTFEIALDGTNNSQGGDGIIQNYIDGTTIGYKDQNSVATRSEGSAPLIAFCIHPLEEMEHERECEARSNSLDQDGIILEVTYSEPKRFNVVSGL